ncbi:hypothetical protein SAMN05444008_1191 [Cnuella takakiae]|uniref:DUF6249 domain-containing protein n=1 Tax=Cnuella takakiae TaxID=1302690 RepID=A0A1M5HD33_9BACT|nr:DUF6249 domain-containing protein [Cnuella takakiae]OLY92824.1 hypothetical protein BUE76_13700 [Cnuella takakiae]SHG13722.1 hypothetical protein SAMN05444008_1191 [Cnuella takakiae]
MNGVELLVPILVPLGAFAMVFGIIYLKTRENMAMIEKGMNPKAFANRPAPYRNLKSGLLFLGAGIGLIIAFFLDKNIGGWNNEAIYFGLIAVGGGLGLIFSYMIEKKETLRQPHVSEATRREPEYREM